MELTVDLEHVIDRRFGLAGDNVDEHARAHGVTEKIMPEPAALVGALDEAEAAASRVDLPAFG